MLSYVDKHNYADEVSPIGDFDCSTNQDALEELLKEYDLPDEVIAQLDEWVEEQVKLGLREFIKKLTIKMSQSLHGFCVLRALGYHAHIESDGKSVESLRQIAKHFKCSHQYVDKLTKDLQRQLGVSIESLNIEKKNYSMTVKPPSGWITLGVAIRTYRVSRSRIQEAISNGVRCKNYKRKSKILRIEDLEKDLGVGENANCRKPTNETL